MAGVSIPIGIEITKAIESVGKLVSSVQSSLPHLSTLSKSLISGLNSDIVQLYNSVTSIGGAISYVGRSLNTFKEFEKLIVKTGGLLNATASELQLVKESALELGATTEYSSTQVADAMSKMALAGFHAKEIIGAMPGLLGMATAGMISVARATGIASEILRTFQIAAKDMDYVAGALTTTFTTTNTTLGTLSYTMKYVGAQASTLGVNLSQVAAIAGILGNLGIKASMAGTGLRQFMEKLAAGLGASEQQSMKGIKALKKMGLTWKDVSDQAGNLSLVKAVGAVGRALDKLGLKAAGRIKMLRSIFGVRASSQIAALIEQGPELLAAKNVEIAFGGAKQQLMGVLIKAQKLKEGFQGIKMDAVELARKFITVGAVGRQNFARLARQMDELGLKGGFFNTQAGLTKERLEKINGKVVKTKSFIPLQDLSASSLKAVHGLSLLKHRIDALATTAEKMKVIKSIFGADTVILKKANKAFLEGGIALKDFANRMLLANSAVDIQKKQLDSLWGSFKLLTSVLDNLKTAIGQIISPVVRIITITTTFFINLFIAGDTLDVKIARWIANLGGIRRFLDQIKEGFDQLSVIGKLFGVLMALTTAFVLFGGTISVITSAVGAIASAFVAPIVAIGAFVTAIGGAILAVLAFIVSGAEIVAVTGAFAGLSIAISGFFSLLGTFLVGLVAVVGGLYLFGPVIANVVGALGVLGSQIGYLIYALLPTFLEMLTQIHDEFMHMGELSLKTNISVSSMQAKMPKGGVVAGVVEFSSAMDNVFERMQYYLNVSMIAALDTTLNVILGSIAMVYSVIIDTVENFGEIVRQVAMRAANNTVAAFMFGQKALGMIVTVAIRAVVKIVRLVLEIIIKMLIASVKGAVGLVIDTVRVLTLDLPGIFLNVLLKLYASIFKVFGAIIVGIADILGELFVMVLDYGKLAIQTVGKILLIAATLPISLPYFGLKAIGMFFDVMYERLTPGFNEIKAVAINFFNQMKAIAKKAMEGLMNLILAPLRIATIDAAKAIANLTKSIISLPRQLYRAIGKIIDGVLDGISSIGDSIFNFFVEFPSNLRRFIIDIFGMVGSMFEKIVYKITSFSYSLASTISKVLELIGKIVVGVIVGTPYMILRVMWAVVSGIATGFVNLVYSIFSTLRRALFTVVNAFLFDGIGHLIRGIYYFFAEGIPQMITNVKNEIADFYSSVLDSIDYFFVDLPNWIMSSIGKLSNFLIKEVLTAPKRIADYFVKLIGNLTEFIISAVHFLTGKGTHKVMGSVWVAVGKVVDAFIEQLKAFPYDLMVAIKKAFGRIKEAFNKAVEQLSKVKWKRVFYGFMNMVEKFVRGAINYGRMLLVSLFDMKGGVIALGTAFAKTVYKMFKTLYNNFPWEGLKKLATNIWAYIKQAAFDVGVQILSSIAQVLEYLSFDGITSRFESFAKWYWDMLDSILNWVPSARKWVDKTLPNTGVGGAAKDVLLGLLDLVEAGAKVAVKVMTPIIDWFRKVAEAAQKVIDIFYKLMLTLKKIGIGNWFKGHNTSDAVRKAFEDAFDVLVSIIPAPLKQLGKTISKYLGFSAGAGGKAVKFITDTFKQMFDTFGKVLKIFSSSFKQVTAMLDANASAFGDWIKTTFSLVFKALGAGDFAVAGKILLNRFSDAFVKISDWFLIWAYNLYIDLYDTLMNSGPIGKTVAGLMQKSINGLDDGIKFIASIIDWLANAIKVSGAVIAEVFGAITGVVTALLGFFGGNSPSASGGGSSTVSTSSTMKATTGLGTMTGQGVQLAKINVRNMFRPVTDAIGYFQKTVNLEKMSQDFKKSAKAWEDWVNKFLKGKDNKYLDVGKILNNFVKGQGQSISSKIGDILSDILVNIFVKVLKSTLGKINQKIPFYLKGPSGVLIKAIQTYGKIKVRRLLLEHKLQTMQPNSKQMIAKLNKNAQYQNMTPEERKKMFGSMSAKDRLSALKLAANKAALEKARKAYVAEHQDDKDKVAREALLKTQNVAQIVNTTHFENHFQFKTNGNAFDANAVGQKVNDSMTLQLSDSNEAPATADNMKLKLNSAIGTSFYRTDPTRAIPTGQP